MSSTSTSAGSASRPRSRRPSRSALQLGEIHERHLHDIEAAIDNYSAALSGDARNQQALTAVERFLVDPDLRGDGRGGARADLCRPAAVV